MKVDKSYIITNDKFSESIKNKIKYENNNKIPRW